MWLVVTLNVCYSMCLFIHFSKAATESHFKYVIPNILEIEPNK